MKIFDEFCKNRNPEAAAQMKRYMREKFEFLGIKRPLRAELEKEFLKEKKKEGRIDWSFVFDCWNREEREFQYLAMDYLNKMSKHLEADDLNRLEKLITEKSWWDTVDMLSKFVGIVYLKNPELKPEIYMMMDSEDIWLKRAAILFQLKFKEETDTRMLADAIRKSSATGEFFLDKAIGWALREYSKTDETWVKSFIAGNELSRLSIREASKYLK